jgi:hypothetical protein
MQEIALNVPQFGYFEKWSLGSSILKSQFFPGLPAERTLRVRISCPMSKTIKLLQRIE